MRLDHAVEFGALGALVYFAFMFYCVLATDAPFVMRLAILIAFLLNGISNPFAHALAISLLVWTSSPGARAEPHAAGTSVNA